MRTDEPGRSPAPRAAAKRKPRKRAAASGSKPASNSTVAAKVATRKAGKRPAKELVATVEEKLRELVELFSAYIEKLHAAIGEGLNSAERSRACGDIERLIRAAERLRDLLVQVKATRGPAVAHTLLAFMRQEAENDREAADAPGASNPERGEIDAETRTDTESDGRPGEE